MKRLAAAFLCAALFAASAATAQEPPAEVGLTIGQKARKAQVLQKGGQAALLFYGPNCWQALWLDAKAMDEGLSRGCNLTSLPPGFFIIVQ